jgi:riboflavin biosynthesis pyrimidine reductase
MNTTSQTTGTLDTLYDNTTGTALPLPRALAEFYGALRLPLRPDRPYVIANMVAGLDGVVSLGIPGKAGGKEISGSNVQDRALMGLLRSVADAVVVGAGTLREGKGEPLTAASIHPPLRSSYSALRAALAKDSEPLAVVVTASGDLDASMPLFKGGEQVLIVTTKDGEQRLRTLPLDKHVKVTAVETEDNGAKNSIPAHAVLEAIAQVRSCTIILVEGGPHLLGDFLAAGAIDEQFLTLSPQILGRVDDAERASGKRLNLVEGHTFAPEHPLWGTLSALKRSASHLFLRYTFTPQDEKL